MKISRNAKLFVFLILVNQGPVPRISLAVEAFPKDIDGHIGEPKGQDDSKALNPPTSDNSADKYSDKDDNESKPQGEKPDEPSISDKADADYLDDGDAAAHHADTPNMFTVTSTDMGLTWGNLPYRERYLWNKKEAPCHSFELKVPDEKAEKSKLTLCIYRPHLEFVDETELFIHVENPEVALEEKEMTVRGFVKEYEVSVIYGKIIDKYFYGEVAINDPETGKDQIYVIEEIKILTKLMRYNEKILRNILFVMNKGTAPSVKYNAVVTKGSSLMNFMTTISPTELVMGSFLVFSTSHNSYITAGEPQMKIDPAGRVSFNAGGDKINIDNEGTVHLISPEREVMFRPLGKTVVQEGTSVDTLQEHEGAVAISAFTTFDSYSCILPTPAFSPTRKGSYVCRVCLTADKLFTEKYTSKLKNRISTPTFLGDVIDQVSWIFRSQDVNENGKPDNIGLDLDYQFDTWSYPDSGQESLTTEEVDAIFVELSALDFSDCCLGIAYTMKALPGNVLAKGPTPTELGKESRLGSISTAAGACDLRTGNDQKNNLILISANNKQGNFSPMTQDQLVYLTAHEVARAFGTKQDGTGEDKCDKFMDNSKIERHYLMWPDVLRNYSIQEKKWSPCTKKYIAQALNTCKTACFDVDKHPFCGNGIVEEGEECDCGSEYDCSLQTCCYPRNGKYPCKTSGIACKKSSEVDTSGSSLKSTTITWAFSSLIALSIWSFIH